MIANDCYKMGHFFWSLRAFDILEKIDADEQYWPAKRGSITGLLQQIMVGKETKDKWGHALMILRHTKNNQAEFIYQKLSEIQL
eukprot:CAMPEP_0116979650 /NCGR_PEP_ID=MMETSP0467-20121206/58591_1 /TAXON_ID=283647 /ORGANISM="Mesodinium pulex, Strain SPMC105" /LENGTH=83 /DNA_ID=CAMNT_0004673427 /DNA_START=1383 /DNA_END=1634 /DNA_ORIENTATION=+